MPVTLGMVTSCANIENRRLLRALEVGARKTGVSIFTGCDVQALHVENGRVTGVRTANRDFHAGAVVNAAGSWGGTLRGAPEHIPVQPERGQMLSLHADTVALSHLINLPQYIIIPRKSGRIVLGCDDRKGRLRPAQHRRSDPGHAPRRHRSYSRSSGGYYRRTLVGLPPLQSRRLSTGWALCSPRLQLRRRSPQVGHPTGAHDRRDHHGPPHDGQHQPGSLPLGPHALW